MTFTAHAAMSHAQRVADKARRLETLKMRQATMLQRYGVTHGNDGHAGSIRIKMRVTPWYSDIADPPGVMTRTVSAVE